MELSNLIFVAASALAGALAGAAVAWLLTSELTKNMVRTVSVLTGITVAALYLKPVLVDEFDNDVRAYLGEELREPAPRQDKPPAKAVSDDAQPEKSPDDPQADGSLASGSGDVQVPELESDSEPDPEPQQARDPVTPQEVPPVSSGAGDITSFILAEMRKNPLMNRVLDDYPEELDLSKDRLLAASEKGVPALRQELQKIGFELGQSLGPKYLPFAQDDDLIAFADATANAVLILADKDPMLCTAWLFGSINGQTFAPGALKQTAGDEPMDRIQETFTKLVINARRTRPSFDRATGQRVMQEGALVMLVAAGSKGFQVIANGAVPESEQVARDACRGSGALYRNILARERSESIPALRVMFAGKQS